ncbi:MAG: preprotein translocase subunit YajC [Deltaproteobacteria bacterium]|nr:preprotein translocase subunit YajC [Deltaproteobacteria bacterium]
MFAIFYFLLIRPQQKKQKQHRSMLSNLRRGDNVVTQGGIHGKVTGLTDTIATVEIAPGVRVRVGRGAISTINTPQQPAPAPKEKGKEEK